MQREIKFRAWVPQEKRMVGGDLVKGQIIQIGQLYETLMQYTGLKDKNGVEIYEGDIVIEKANTKIWSVEYRTDTEYVGFLLKEKSNYISTFVSWASVEVIGNIYEHKHLLDSTLTK